MVGDRWLQTAYSYLYIRNFERALEAFRKAIESDPANPECYFHASITALRNQRYSEAGEWAVAAVSLDPDNRMYQMQCAAVEAALLVADARSALQEGDTNRARDLLAAALERDPLNDEAEQQLQLLGASTV